MPDAPSSARCCMPSGGGAAEPPRLLPTPRHRTSADGMVLLPGGEFLMGAEDDEGFP